MECEDTLDKSSYNCQAVFYGEDTEKKLERLWTSWKLRGVPTNHLIIRRLTVGNSPVIIISTTSKEDSDSWNPPSSASSP